MKNCVFAGTFDPPTLGHKDIVMKSLELFDEVIVAILINPNKKPLFTTVSSGSILPLMVILITIRKYLNFYQNI